MSDHARGRFVWCDLMTTETDAAEAFYKRVLGWGTTRWGESYPMFTVEGVSLGGVNELPRDALAAGARPHWLAYIGTDDVDATVARAEELGATIMHPPTDIPGVGRFAVIADPQGALFAAFTSEGDAPGHDGTPRVGELSWFELATTSYQGGFEFYSALFGWERGAAMDMGEGAIYQLVRREGSDADFGGLFDMPPAVRAPHWLLYVQVDDIDAACERVVAGGGQVVNGPMEVAGGDRVAQAIDPQGASFAIHWRNA